MHADKTIRKWECNGSSDRHVRLALWALARALLPGEISDGEDAGVLCGALRYRRAEQHVLSPASRRRGGGVEARVASRVSVCREGQPLSDAHEETEGRWSGRHPILRARAGVGAQARSGRVSVAAQVASEPVAPRSISRPAAETSPL